MQVTSILQPLVRYRTNLGLDLISIDRIENCCKSAQESATSLATVKAPDLWPSRGEISFKSVSASYHGANRLCLENVDFTLGAGQSLAIVGRTGSGKSSLALTLLGMVNPTEGRIEIDGLDTSLLSPESLRSKISVVPQSPPIFLGSLRENLDPEGTFDDAKIRKVIERSGLGHMLQSEGDVLDLEVNDNLSGGQVQLIAITRALLLERKILVMDEATAALDQGSGAAVQHLLQTEFSDCTVLAITHRLQQVRDYDCVLVLNEGRVEGFGNPNNLLQDPESCLSRLMHPTPNNQSDGQE
ncbi:P-loop containing nucleoside triphosphate hydrolase protein [Dactylonectria macrodidyma]|uniref:P-loop containing nucleoside triphosphate hydrolase protein n=1 Tax=Dactylonectria macrodidyma TaxID=307937 RepID=A0A9P9CXE5_9HYPO|nr:P-loop containing nucleoside triphosphate hydrolase protein [Dactylonectria macrodidyma]